MEETPEAIETSTGGDPFGLTGATLAERYQVDRQIAEGGFAVIYRAVQIALDRPVALKVLKMPHGLDEAGRTRFRSRFAAEARTIARLNHPHVVDVYDYGVSRMASGEIAPWMALEWLDGETLEANLNRRRGAGGRPTPSAVALLRPVIAALAHAHRRGIVHRDIKPANVMIVATDEGPRLRMLDFGIAKWLPEGRSDGTNPGGSAAGVAAFSPDYAAPEQVTFSRTGPFTDVHALGLLLTELLTDEPPYRPGAEEHMFEQVMSPERPTPRRKGKAVGRLEHVIAKAVALSPGRRFPDAGELLAAVDAAEPVRPALRASDARTTVRVYRRMPRAALRPHPAPATRTPFRRELGDLAPAVAGGLAMVGALAFLVTSLAESGARRPPSPSAELSAARRASAARRPPARAPTVRQASQPQVAPWIVPMGAAVPTDAAAQAVVRQAEIIVAPGPTPIGAAIGTSEPRRVAGRGPARAGSELCSMSINSTPWSEVWVDGLNTGRHTPLVDYRLPCGRHRIGLKRADLAIDESASIVVKRGELFKQGYALAGMD
jgi:serine/threonine protein kinase